MVLGKGVFSVLMQLKLRSAVHAVVTRSIQVNDVRREIELGVGWHGQKSQSGYVASHSDPFQVSFFPYFLKTIYKPALIKAGGANR